MQWGQIEGSWDKVKGKLLERWGKFTDNDLALIGGKKDDLIGRIKHVYGVAKEDAETQIEEFRASLKDVKKHNPQ
jgi:uncharacterized protein YjbJ (UPF0337 family)